MSVDDSYNKLVIDNKVIVKVTVVEKNLQFQWADEWAQWTESQDSPELRQIAQKNASVWLKLGKGSGKSKAAAAAHH